MATFQSPFTPGQSGVDYYDAARKATISQPALASPPIFHPVENTPPAPAPPTYYAPSSNQTAMTNTGGGSPMRQQFSQALAAAGSALSSGNMAAAGQALSQASQLILSK